MSSPENLRETVRGGPSSAVETACPLDCPGRVQPGRHGAARQGRRRSTARTRIPSPTATSARRSGSSASACTARIACCIPRSARAAKARASSSASRGTKRSSSSPIAFETREGRRGRRVDPAVLLRRLERPAHAGQPRRAAVAPLRHVASGAHGVRGADRRRQHGALRQDAVGHLSGLSGRRADHPVGRQPVGVGHSPRARTCARRRSAARSSSSSIRGRRRSRASADVHLRGQAGHRRRPSRSRSTGYLFANGHADEAFLREHTHGRRRSCASAPSRGRSSAPPTSAGIDAAALEQVARAVRRRARRRSIRCGWGLERNRNGGNAAMAVLALPAVGGKFGVRGGGYSMSNSASWDIDRTVDRRAGAATRASST